jgi:porin
MKLLTIASVLRGSSLSLLVSLCWAPPAHALGQQDGGLGDSAEFAQDTGDVQKLSQVPPVTGIPEENPKAKAPAVPANTPDDFAKFDALGEPGLSIVYPGSYDSFLTDLGGWRSALAEHDISFTLRGTGVFNYDVLQGNRPANPQAYAGQKFTAQSESAYFTITAGLAKFGLPNSKLIIGGISYGTTWPASQGHSEGVPKFDKLAYYQSFLNGAVTVKTGYLVNYLEFIGVFTGGSPLLATGLSSLVPIEVGLSADPAPTPTFNLSLYGPNGLYFKGGVQRSTSPLGLEYEAAHDGPVNLRFGADRAKALYIAEFGIQRPATEKNSSLWVRGGVLYNTSDYSNLRNGNFENNYSIFGLADYQISKPYPSMPYRGIFAGASVFYAKPDVNVISQYYEARLYSIGLMESRPADGMTFNINHSSYSNAARYAYTQQNVLTPSGQLGITVSYSAHVMRGLYFSPNLSYVHHPGFGDYRDAVVVGVNLFVNM